MFTQLSGFLDTPILWRHCGVLFFVCLWWLVFFQWRYLQRFSMHCWVQRRWGRREVVGRGNYFKMQSSHRPKHIWLRIKSVLLSTKISFICIRCWYSQASLLLPVLFLPTASIFFSSKMPRRPRNAWVGLFLLLRNWSRASKSLLPIFMQLLQPLTTSFPVHSPQE